MCVGNIMIVEACEELPSRLERTDGAIWFMLEGFGNDLEEHPGHNRGDKLCGITLRDFIAVLLVQELRPPTAWTSAWIRGVHTEIYSLFEGLSRKQFMMQPSSG